MKIKVPKKIIPIFKNLRIKFPFKFSLSKQNSKFLMVVVVPVLATLVFLFFAKSLFVVAWVNKSPVFRINLIRELEKQGGTQVLDSIITEKLILQEASRNKVVVSKSEIDEQISSIEGQLKAQGVDLETALSMQGQNRSDLEKSVKLKLYLEKILGDKLKISETEIEEYYNTNKASLYANKKLDEVSSSIESSLKQQKLSENYQELITKLKENSSIKYWITF
jgi:foldase protein PrsA